jgi:hypothetical protein
MLLGASWEIRSNHSSTLRSQAGNVGQAESRSVSVASLPYSHLAPFIPGKRRAGRLVSFKIPVIHNVSSRLRQLAIDIDLAHSNDLVPVTTTPRPARARGTLSPAAPACSCSIRGR